MFSSQSDIGQFTALRYKETLDVALLTESLREVQKKFMKLTAHIEKRVSPVSGRGERFFWTQTPAQTETDHPESDFVQALQVCITVRPHTCTNTCVACVCVEMHMLVCLCYVKVDAEVLDSAEEWDQCVRKVCPANDSTHWNELPGSIPAHTR